jgi:hypothetical protein
MTDEPKVPWWRIKKPTQRPSAHQPPLSPRRRSQRPSWRRMVAAGYGHVGANYGKSWWTR